MSCEQVREALSAMLDGEDPGVPAEDVDTHLDGCPGCRTWYDAAAAVTRGVRLTPAVATPDLAPAVLAQARIPKLPRRLLAVRIGLVLLGVAQVVVTALQLWAPEVAGHMGHGDAMTAGPMHLEHESAAWGFALAAGFCWIAWQTRRAAGMVPVLGVFILVLSVLVGIDLSSNAVTLSRAASHGLLVIGFVLVVYVSRTTGRDSHPHGGRPLTTPVDTDSAPYTTPERTDHAA